MANLIERKRRRRRKEIKSSVCPLLSEVNSNNHDDEDETKLRLHHQTISIRESITCLVGAQNGNGQEKCESENGIKQQQQQPRRLHPLPLQQQLPSRFYSLRRTTNSRLTSAIHIMGQRGRFFCSSSSLMSLSLLLLLSVAFTFTLSPLLPMNLILLTEASGNNNNNNQQQQQSQQLGAQQRQMAVGSTGFGGNSVMAPSSNGKARYKTIYACEDTQLTIDCDFGSKINLIRANYGRFSLAQCNEQGLLDLKIDCMSPITFRVMRERCQDKQKCSVNATNSIFGDKCPETRKYLEVHFQCQIDQRQLQQQQQQQHQQVNNNYEQPDRVDLRNSSLLATPTSHNVYPQPSTTTISGSSPVLPPNNPTTAIGGSNNGNNNNHYARPVSNNIDESQPVQVHAPPHSQRPKPWTYTNSDIASFDSVADSRVSSSSSSSYNANNNNFSQLANEQIIVTLRHLHTENMSNPRCVLWEPSTSTWTERGSRIVDTNSTHTTCAFDQATSYMLIMDYSAANPTISQMNAPPIPSQPFYLPPAIQPPVPRIESPIPRILDFQPVLLDGNHQQQDSANKFNQQQQQSGSTSSSSSLVKFFSLFGYMLAIVFVAIAFITIAFIASTMRTSGKTLKSLGNFTAFGGPKYKNRRADEGLHNKDLLVINNQNGHQFLYAPASTTKINSNSTSTHVMPRSLAGQHQGTLHHHIQHQQQLQQQQQMYSGTNGTLSNLSATGGQSNYYYGLMGSLFQQQQQQHQQSQLQHHLSTLHLNQQHQMQQQQGLQAANYQHQTDKSTISNESANSTPSSSGVESASTSLHQQQQQPQSCLMMNSEYNLMGQVNNYNQQQQQHQTLISSHHYQPQLTLNAHYSSSGPMNMGASQQQQQRLMLNSNNNQLIREHIYESVDDDNKQCMTRGVFHPTDQSEQLFNSNTLGQQVVSQGNQQADLNRAMTLSSRLLQNAIQQQQLQQQQQQQPLINSSQANNNNKRLNSHPAIVRDNQTKTNIICSKLAQVTPQRATEINKFQHDIMAIFNGTDTTTTTATTASTALSLPSNGNSSGFNRSDLVSDLGDVCNGGAGNSKVSTDC